MYYLLRTRVTAVSIHRRMTTTPTLGIPCVLKNVKNNAKWLLFQNNNILWQVCPKKQLNFPTMTMKTTCSSGMNSPPPSHDDTRDVLRDKESRLTSSASTHPGGGESRLDMWGFVLLLLSLMCMGLRPGIWTLNNMPFWNTKVVYII